MRRMRHEYLRWWKSKIIFWRDLLEADLRSIRRANRRCSRWRFRIRESLSLAETWWRCACVFCLFGILRQLNPFFDHFFLFCSLGGVAPPHGTFVNTRNTQVVACFTAGLSLVTLLSAQTASVTTFESGVSNGRA